MNKRGRPPKKEGEKRDSLNILVRFNQSEARRIRKAHGKNLPALWARETLLQSAP